MSYPLVKIFLDEVRKFINNLPIETRRKIAVATTAISEGSFDLVYVKQLRKEIKEVRIQKYRLIFFTHQDSIYFIKIFIKKTTKTPIKEIKLAEKYYKLITDK